MSRCPYTITLSDADREYLQKTSRCRTSPAHMADRSRILLKKDKKVMRTEKLHRGLISALIRCGSAFRNTVKAV